MDHHALILVYSCCIYKNNLSYTISSCYNNRNPKIYLLQKPKSCKIGQSPKSLDRDVQIIILHWVPSKVYMNPKLHEPLWGSFTLQTTKCSLHFDKLQKKKILYLIVDIFKRRRVLYHSSWFRESSDYITVSNQRL